MVNRLLCHLHPRRSGLGPSNLRQSYCSRRSSYCSMVLVHWFLYGFLHSKLRYRVPAPTKHELIMLVSELVSAYPTAGGMYFVTKYVVPPEHVALWSWIIGWCNFLGQTAGVSSVAYTVSQAILACASMNSHYENGVYSYSPYVSAGSTLMILVSDQA
jgi:hypothetical protein